jgi:hypothetical protein
MKFRMKIEIGNVEIAMRGPWMMKRQREVSSWWVKFGPLIFVRDGLPFSRVAASRIFKELDAGPTGRLARLYKPN